MPPADPTLAPLFQLGPWGIVLGVLLTIALSKVLPVILPAFQKRLEAGATAAADAETKRVESDAAREKLLTDLVKAAQTHYEGLIAALREDMRARDREFVAALDRLGEKHQQAVRDIIARSEKEPAHAPA